MENGSNILSLEGGSNCEIARAIALCAIHDLRINLFRFNRFPQILVNLLMESSRSPSARKANVRRTTNLF